MKQCKWMIVAALATPMTGCVAEELDGEGADLAEPATSTTESALCIAPQTPPPYDLGPWYLTSSNTYDIKAVDPENGECDDYVIAAHNVEDFTVWSTEAADTAEKCVGTTLYVRSYLQTANGWVYDGIVSDTGVWTYQGCQLPKIEVRTHHQSHARIQVRTQRSYTSGQFSVRQYGLPFVVRADVYEVDVPN